MGTTDFVLTSAVIDPKTKSNITTYITKDNVPIKFNLVNHEIDSNQSILRIYYYRTVRNKAVKIRCLDTIYFGGSVLNLVPASLFNVLRATNRLNSCLFMYDFEYKTSNKKETADKNMVYAFKVVTDKEDEMYKALEKAKNQDEENGVILRPKKQP